MIEGHRRGAEIGSAQALWRLRWRASVPVALFHLVGSHARSRAVWPTWPSRACQNSSRDQSRCPRVATILSHRRPASMSSCSRHLSSVSMSCALWPSFATAVEFAVPLFAVTSPQVKPDADRLGYTSAHRGAPAVRCCQACASISPMRAKSPKPTAGSALATNSAKTGQHLRRLWLSADAGVDGSLRRCCRQSGKIGMTNEHEDFRCPARHGTHRPRAGACGLRRIFCPLRPRSASPVSSRGRRINLPANLTSTRS